MPPGTGARNEFLNGTAKSENVAKKNIRLTSAFNVMNIPLKQNYSNLETLTPAIADLITGIILLINWII
jgi:hypothetical protein